MSPKPRNNENKTLPKGWRFKHGAYYFRPASNIRHLWDDKTEFRLGSSIGEAYNEWSKRLDIRENASTMAELLDRYAAEVVPTKAPRTQESNIGSIRKLRAVFGHMPIDSVKPKHVFQYRDKRGKQGKVAANHDIACLSHAFSKAIEWGLVEEHPIKSKVTKFSTAPRTRYIENWELEEAMKVASPFIACYIVLKLLTGLRRSDLLSVKMTDLQENGIHITPRKTANSSGKHIIIQWSDALKSAVSVASSLSPHENRQWLFQNRKGEPYIKADGTASGFKSVWQRFMSKVLAKTKVKVHFTEHDLRAKVASDTDAQHAQQLLGHADINLTNRVYRRKPEVVKPAK